MNSEPRHWLSRLRTSLEIPAPEAAHTLRRIEIVERNLLLPVKCGGIAMLLYSFAFTSWFGTVFSALNVAVDYVQYFIGIYVAVNVAVGVILVNLRRVPLPLLQWTVFFVSLVDGVFVGALVLVSGGYDSILYWLFVVFIMRNAASVPAALPQLVLNFCISLCYVLAGVLEVAMIHNVAENLSDKTRLALDMELRENSIEQFLSRIVALWLMAACCYGIQVLLEKQRLALEEAREFWLREGQLRSAGRLAAEITHQIKNPLAIINTAAYSLRRALGDARADGVRQVEIIQEEVERSDRIITQLMGYAKLAEGHVERLDVTAELDEAIKQVFPRGADYATRIQRDYGGHFPPLLMQRSHLSEVLINLLQNAREATGGAGHISVRARSHPDRSVEIEIADDGPGIPPDKVERIFEPYYTTKSKGTGLGLAIVRHNVELYAGKVRLESALGKGARFTLVFPAKTQI